MAVLGVDGTTSALWPAIISDDEAVVDGPSTLSPVSNTPQDESVGVLQW